MTYNNVEDPANAASLTSRGPAAAGSRLGLPLNRKERYYTGTVLPGIVACDDFGHLDRLLACCGLADMEVGDLAALQFFTEYNFAESVFTTADDASFADRPRISDTPDLVVKGPDWLLTIEAKMFHNPTAADLTHQYEQQAKLVTYWRSKFSIAEPRSRHVLLLPEQLYEKLRPALPRDVITWQQVLDAYADVAPQFWIKVLRTALARYADLVSPASPWGQNADGKLTGLQIVQALKGHDTSVRWIGRRGGIDGALLADDVASNAWRSRRYEVSAAAVPPNPWWFSIEDFVTRVSEQPSAADDESEDELDAAGAPGDLEIWLGSDGVPRVHTVPPNGR